MTHAVRRDEFGIPHLRAGSVDELAWLQGWVTARDRAWQVELQRLRVEGRTAEVLGESGLAWDRFARQARIADVARRAFDSLDRETRSWVRAYVEGVDEGLELGLAQAPEPGLAGCAVAEGEALRPWEPWTPLGIFLVEHILMSTFPHKLFREHVVRTLGADWLDVFTLDGGATSGSNAWAIGPSRTATGGALVAADPHRLVELPGCYQQVQLACPEFDVLGLAFPGVPGVQHFAHAGRVAWAVTNAMADYQDLVVETLRLDAAGVLVTDGPAGSAGSDGSDGSEGAEPVEHWTETVRVHRGDGTLDEVTVPVAVTARGPVVCGLDRALGEVTAGASSAAYSLVCPSGVAGDLGFGTFLPLLRSRSVDDVTTALAGWVEPVNSVVVADTSGHVRHLVAGRVPRRDDLARELPLAAHDPRGHWDGWEVAAVRDGDLAVTANDADGGLGLAHRPIAPHRSRRIRRLLGERHELTVDDFVDLQTDTFLPTAALVTAHLREAAVGAEAATVRDRIVAWNGWMDSDSVAAADFAAWRHELVRWVVAQPALAPLHEPTGHDDLYAPWLDVTAQVGHAWEAFLRCGDKLGLDLAAGVAAALEAVAARRAADASSSTATATSVSASAGPWGDGHRLRPIHALTPVVGAEVRLDVPLPGDADCVWASSSVPGHTDLCHRAPVARVVWDLADREQSRWVVPFGASGLPGDPHFDDQLALWASGRLVPVAGLDVDPAGTAVTAGTADTVGTTDTEPVLPTPGAPGDRWQEDLAGLGRVTVRPLDTDTDIDEVHRWVDDERARFWGMVGKSAADVADIYRFVATLETHHAWLVAVDDVPTALVQTYDPRYDPVGECYDATPGEVGVHLLLAPPGPGPRVPGRSSLVIGGIVRWILGFADVTRIVVEPDHRNTRAIDRLTGLGFEAGPLVQLPEKVGQLAFLDRATGEALLAAQDGAHAGPPRAGRG